MSPYPNKHFLKYFLLITLGSAFALPISFRPFGPSALLGESPLVLEVYGFDFTSLPEIVKLRQHLKQVKPMWFLLGGNRKNKRVFLGDVEVAYWQSFGAEKNTKKLGHKNSPNMEKTQDRAEVWRGRKYLNMSQAVNLPDKKNFSNAHWGF